MILGNWREFFFLSLQQRKYGNPLTTSVQWSPERLFFKDFNKSDLQAAPIGESGLWVLQKEMDELAFSSNHYPEFLPTKEFWKWAKIFTELQESSVTENLKFTKCKKISYNSFVIHILGSSGFTSRMSVSLWWSNIFLCLSTDYFSLCTTICDTYAKVYSKEILRSMF